MISVKLFETAYAPHWQETLDELELLALPEPWKFANPLIERKNDTNPILEKYIFSVYQNQVMEYRNAQTPAEADKHLCARSGYICFHTGLMNRRHKSIYGFLEKNRRPGSLNEWFLKGFFDDTSTALRNVETLPDKPFSHFRTEQWGFCPTSDIRVNVDHILDEAENRDRIPEMLRDFPNLPLLLETGVELARRWATYMPSLVVPQLYRGDIQFLLPICLHDPKQADMAMTLSPMDGYYIGHTCLTLEMAYKNARLLARPTAPWLAQIVA